MRDKRIYIKSIAITEKDLNLIKKLRFKKEFNKKSLAGILSLIINQYVNLPKVSK